MWANLLFSRIGTALLHITTTGLMGWGIALAWQKRQYGRLFLIYLVSAFLHGAWNTCVMFYSFSALAIQTSSTNPISKVGPYMLGVSIAVLVILLTILLLTNARLIKTNQAAEPQTDGNITV
jgi:hypothetical protein